jgi:bifunctional non-homologous end joining protein LigD
MKNIIPFRIRPMLATLVSEPFDEPGWAYEEKYDGIRILAYKQGAKVILRSRNDKDRTASFPAIVAAIDSLPNSTLLLDGEVIALDRAKVSRFQMLQRGGRARYAVFDCLFLNGEGLPHGTFLSPKLIAQISYTELTKDGKLRHPVFIDLRDDKDAKDVSLPKI